MEIDGNRLVSFDFLGRRTHLARAAYRRGVARWRTAGRRQAAGGRPGHWPVTGTHTPRTPGGKIGPISYNILIYHIIYIDLYCQYHH